MLGNIAIRQAAQTWGGMWREYLDANQDSCQTSEGRRLNVSETRMRSWVNENRSPAVDWLLLNAHRLPASFRAKLINRLAQGEFVVEPVERDDARAEADLLVATIDLHSPIADIAGDLARAQADGMITVGEAEPILRKSSAALKNLKFVHLRLTLIVVKSKAMRLVGRAWRQA